MDPQITEFVLSLVAVIAKTIILNKYLTSTCNYLPHLHHEPTYIIQSFTQIPMKINMPNYAH